MSVPKKLFVPLAPTLQPFPYGKEGHKSLAARLAKSVLGDEVTIKETQPYGEVWLGSTHVNGISHLLPSAVEGGPPLWKELAAKILPSSVIKTPSLKDVIASDPAFYLGPEFLQSPLAKTYVSQDGNLPFLFKVLSFDKALPLQAHPDRETAKKLKEADDKSWKSNDFVDYQHKPEVCVALTPFTGFIGFRPPAQIVKFIESSATLRSLLPTALASSVGQTAAQHASEEGNKTFLQQMFDVLIKLPKSDVERAIHAIQTDASEQRILESEPGLKEVFEKTVGAYGDNDVGVIVSTFMLNLIKLKKGEGAWILADDIHAYVEGDVIECMANSDNMIAHGLGESGMGGVQTFVDALSYRHVGPDALRLDVTEEKGWKRYKTPMEEFDLLNLLIPISTTSSTTSTPIKIDGPLVLTVISLSSSKASLRLGNGESEEQLDLREGSTIFVRAGTEWTVDVSIAGTGTTDASSVVGTGDVEIWGAFVEA